MVDLVFTLRDDSARAYVDGLTDLSGPYFERWILVTRHNGVAWVVRRRLIGAQEITCAARGYQAFEHWPLTTYTGRARGGVAIERTPDVVHLIIRREVLDRLHAMPWGRGHIHQVDWRLTVWRSRWAAEARQNGTQTWSRLV